MAKTSSYTVKKAFTLDRIIESGETVKLTESQATDLIAWGCIEEPAPEPEPATTTSSSSTSTTTKPAATA